MKLLFFFLITAGTVAYVSGQCSPCTCSGTADVNKTLISCAGVPDSITITLSDQSIVHLSANALDSNIILKDLYLYKNKIKSIPPGFLSKNTFLNILHLGTNQITNIPAGFLANNTDLFYLSLSSNKISTVPLGFLSQNQKLENLFVLNNPWNCYDCNVQSLGRMPVYKNGDSYSYYPAYCNGTTTNIGDSNICTTTTTVRETLTTTGTPTFITPYTFNHGTLKCGGVDVGATFFVAELNKSFKRANSTLNLIKNEAFDYSSVCTTGVMDMNNMFYQLGNFDQNISTWDTSSVTTMSLMFGQAASFKQSISNWDTSRVTAMFSMFAGAEQFNSDISNWDTSSVTDMHYMFQAAYSFNRSLTNWCVNIQEPEHFKSYAYAPWATNAAFQPLWNGIGCTRPCYNGGVRNTSDTVDYSCICTPPYVGLYCRDAAFTYESTVTTIAPAPTLPTTASPGVLTTICDARPCQNDGKCIDDPLNSTKFSCECVTPFIGEVCEYAIIDFQNISNGTTNIFVAHLEARSLEDVTFYFKGFDPITQDDFFFKSDGSRRITFSTTMFICESENSCMPKQTKTQENFTFSQLHLYKTEFAVDNTLNETKKETIKFTIDMVKLTETTARRRETLPIWESNNTNTGNASQIFQFAIAKQAFLCPLNFCNANGQCVGRFGIAACDCDAGWTGQTCQTAVSEKKDKMDWKIWGPVIGGTGAVGIFLLYWAIARPSFLPFSARGYIL